MAYSNDQRFDNRYGNRPQGGGSRPNNGPGFNRAPAPAPAKDFPADYVDFAEELMSEWYRSITTSKLRNLLSLMMDIYNAETLRTGDTLSDESMVKIQMARIRIAYECGRDPNTQRFAAAAYLMPWLKAIGSSRDKALHYIHYMEALVAYHRFFGGREN